MRLSRRSRPSSQRCMSSRGRLSTADPIVVIEAMKMLHTLTAGGPGVVDEVRVAPGDHVETNQILITFEHPEETEDA